MKVDSEDLRGLSSLILLCQISLACQLLEKWTSAACNVLLKISTCVSETFQENTAITTFYVSFLSHIHQGSMAHVETLIVMRHGQRADAVGETWAQQNSRPWDPPLSKEGLQQARSTGEILAHIPKIWETKRTTIFSSPHTRFLETACTVGNFLPNSKLIINVGLAESYDWYNSIRYVNSRDIRTADGKYKNMGEWFFHKRMLEKDGWRLRKGSYDSETIRRCLRARNIPCIGDFPNFEFTVNLGLSPVRDQRYIQALHQCLDAVRSSTKVIVTHMAGVRTIFRHLLHASPGHIDTACFFIVQRPAGAEKWTLVQDALSASRQNVLAKSLMLTAMTSVEMKLRKHRGKTQQKSNKIRRSRKARRRSKSV